MRIWKLDNDDENNDFLVLDETKWLEVQEKYKFDGDSIGALWKPIEVIAHEDKGCADSLYLMAGIPVFSEKAIQALYDYITDVVEILPLIYSKGKYYAINVIEILDCIDFSKAVCTRFKSSGRIMKFEKFSFIETYVRGKNIFRIADIPRSAIFVSDEFRECVLNSGLTGFKFSLVWDSETIE